MSERDRPASIRMFLAGDVMTGRGIDQVLPHPGDPRLWERHASSSLHYVELAEMASGPIAKPVGFPYVWGDALDELRRVEPDFSLVNLETSVTTSGDHVAKGINYKMSPANVPCIAAARIDCCSLANNHVLDWGRRGLEETLVTLAREKIAVAGAGRDAVAAAAPAIREIAGKGRIVVFGFCCQSSGVAADWAAAPNIPGVNLLPDLSRRTVARIAEQVGAVKRPGDVVVASIHWGGNWGYRVSTKERAFAHRLIAVAGVDIVHGHSSHHAKGIEVYQDKLILYGCGDFLNDYEGIPGYEAFRPDLALMYLPTVASADGRLAELAIVPYRLRKFRLERASRADAEWLADVLTREGAAFGTHAEVSSQSDLRLCWS